MFLWYNQSLPLQITMMGTHDDVLLSIIDVSARRAHGRELVSYL